MRIENEEFEYEKGMEVLENGDKMVKRIWEREDLCEFSINMINGIEERMWRKEIEIKIGRKRIDEERKDEIENDSVGLKGKVR